MKDIQTKIKKEISLCKKNYKERIEEKFASGNALEVWKGMRQMTGFGIKQHHCVDSSPAFADELNAFYARFDTHDLSKVVVWTTIPHGLYHTLYHTLRDHFM